MENSAKILKLIQKNPGIYVREIIKKTRLSNGAVQHHLDKLEKNSKIKSDKRPRYKRYYSVEINSEEYPIIANIRKESKKNLLFAILCANELSFEQLIHKLHKSPSTVSWNISGLIQDGIIERVTKNRKHVYRIKNKPLLKRTFEKEFSKLFKESFDHDEDIFLAL